MSKKSNVHPDHYKTAGRDPQGQAVIQEVERQKFRQQEAFLEKQAGRRNPVSAANRVRTPEQNRSLDTTSGQENNREREHVNDQPQRSNTKESAETKPTRRVAAKPKASAEKKATRRVAAKPKASAEKKPTRRVAAKPKASGKNKPTRRVAAKPKASAEKKPTRRVAAKPKASGKNKPTRRVAGKKRASAPRAAKPKSKSQKQVSKRAVEKRLRPSARSRRK